MSAANASMTPQKGLDQWPNIVQSKLQYTFAWVDVVTLHLSISKKTVFVLAMDTKYNISKGAISTTGVGGGGTSSNSPYSRTVAN
jgi:hypothetical protein